ncbi:MAG: hypothetical protein H6Q32_1049 [Bacteroidetes bacterium]|nr:hypothetical protein [Bacteroidota bacterium]
MWSSWQVNPAQNTLGILRRADLMPNEMASWQVQSNLEKWLDDPFSRRALIETVQALCGQNGAPKPAASKEEWRAYLVPRLMESFRRGDLLLLRDIRMEGSGENENPPQPVAAAAPARQTRRDKTWIEIELVDNEGNPVPNEPCRLNLPDDSIWEGTTNAEGVVRVDFIDHGQCEVCFPNLDLNEWEPVDRAA